MPYLANARDTSSRRRSQKNLLLSLPGSLVIRWKILLCGDRSDHFRPSGKDGRDSHSGAENRCRICPLLDSTRCCRIELAGARVIEHGSISPGPDPSIYVFTKRDLQRNLFRIPLH